MANERSYTNKGSPTAWTQPSTIMSSSEDEYMHDDYDDDEDIDDASMGYEDSDADIDG